jgi:hypothetical protein
MIPKSLEMWLCKFLNVRRIFYFFLTIPNPQLQ